MWRTEGSLQVAGDGCHWTGFAAACWTLLRWRSKGTTRLRPSCMVYSTAQRPFLGTTTADGKKGRALGQCGSPTALGHWRGVLLLLSTCSCCSGRSQCRLLRPDEVLAARQRHNSVRDFPAVETNCGTKAGLSKWCPQRRTKVKAWLWRSPEVEEKPRRGAVVVISWS
jgi:hypothetical protein